MNFQNIDSASQCQVKCQDYSRDICVAFAYSDDIASCALYRNGPYTYGAEREHTKCYLMPTGRQFIMGFQEHANVIMVLTIF